MKNKISNEEKDFLKIIADYCNMSTQEFLNRYFLGNFDLFHELYLELDFDFNLKNEDEILTFLDFIQNELPIWLKYKTMNKYEKNYTN